MLADLGYLALSPHVRNLARLLEEALGRSWEILIGPRIAGSLFGLEPHLEARGTDYLLLFCVRVNQE